MTTTWDSNVKIDLKILGGQVMTTKWDSNVKIDLRGTGNDNEMRQQC
jgi:hypothetical protein